MNKSDTPDSTDHKLIYSGELIFFNPVRSKGPCVVVPGQCAPIHERLFRKDPDVRFRLHSAISSKKGLWGADRKWHSYDEAITPQGERTFCGYLAGGMRDFHISDLVPGLFAETSDWLCGGIQRNPLSIKEMATIIQTSRDGATSPVPLLPSFYVRAVKGMTMYCEGKPIIVQKLTAPFFLTAVEKLLKKVRYAETGVKFCATFGHGWSKTKAALQLVTNMYNCHLIYVGYDPIPGVPVPKTYVPAEIWPTTNRREVYSVPYVADDMFDQLDPDSSELELMYNTKGFFPREIPII